MVWEHLTVTKAHVAYACIGVFSISFSLVSYVVKEKLYFGESTAATIFGLIVGPHCLDWFNPASWGNIDNLTLELSRVVLCVQIFATAVELPKKYMLKHWTSVFMLLVPVMTAGWLIVGAFIYLVMPGLSFPEGLLIAACITATDPVLSQSIVAGAFAQTHVPKHLRNLISAESGCNDGMAFPFIYLSLHLVVDKGNAGEIVKSWICITLLYECILGCLIGVVIGYCGRHVIKYCEMKKYIDRESFLAFYIILAVTCAGFGSILAVDDLLVSFAAGAAFAWDGWFSKKTHETHISTVIDLLLNYSYFIYLGSIIPWQEYNNHYLGLDVWRLIILSIVIIFLRRLPAVLAFWKFIPDIKSIREALFVGWFGSIGVGAIFASILARAELEHYSTHVKDVPLAELPSSNEKYYRVMYIIWPLVTFFVITSILVHGSSVAMMMLGRHLNTITLTRTFTAHTTNGGNKGPAWMQRLPELNNDDDRSVSLQRIDTLAPSNVSSDEKRSSNMEKDEEKYDDEDEDDYVDTQLTKTPSAPAVSEDFNGSRARPIGGAKRKPKDSKAVKKFKKLRRKRQKFFGQETDIDKTHEKLDKERIKREKEAKAASFALSSVANSRQQTPYPTENNEDHYAAIPGAPGGRRRSAISEGLSEGAIDNHDYYHEDEASYADYDYDEDQDEDQVYGSHGNKYAFQNPDNNLNLEYNYSDEEYAPDEKPSKHGQEEMHGEKEIGDMSPQHLERIASHISESERRKNDGLEPENVEFKEQDSKDSGEKASSSDKESTNTATVTKEEALRKIYSLTHESGNVAFTEGKHIILEDRDGEVIAQATLNDDSSLVSSASQKSEKEASLERSKSNASSGNKLTRVLSDGASSLKKVLSSEQQFPKESRTAKERKKYYAYKIDNQLIIENESGEVLRRYKIKTHEKATKKSSKDDADKNRPRSDSFMNKALQKVGIKRTSSQSTSVKDQKPNKQTTLPYEQPHSNDPPKGFSSSADASFRYRRRRRRRNDDDDEEGEEENEASDNESYDENGESEADYDDEDQEDETEIERYRRLAAVEAEKQKKANK
ncbi:hypothetical protein ACO0QE_002703 [Hanseniaspora vineae]